MKIRILPLAALLLLFSGIAHANYIGGIRSDRRDIAWLSFDDLITIHFSYKIDPHEGARFALIPYTGESSPAPWAHENAGVFPTGEGRADLWCSVPAGERLVTHIKVVMFTYDWGEELLAIKIPVEYHFSEKGITNLEYSHSSPSWLMYGEDLEIQHDISSDEAGYLFARPYFQGSIASGYVASGGRMVTPPLSTVSHYFHFNSGLADVDAIRYQFWNSDLTEVIWEAFLPVEYHWREHGLSNFSFTCWSPSYLAYDEPVTCSFDYKTSASAGVKIWVFGATNGTPTLLDARYEPSPILTDLEGSTSRYYRYIADKDLTHAYVLMKDAVSNDVLMAAFVPLEAHYRAHSVNWLVLTPGAPAILDFHEPIDIDFNYRTTGVNSVHCWFNGQANDEVIQEYATIGGPEYPPFSGMGSSWWTYIGASDILVDELKVRMYDTVEEEEILEAFYPMQHYYGTSAMVTGLEEETPTAATALLPNFPNPFNPKTTISFNMGEAGAARLAVFDVKGRLVRTLLDRHLASGPHAIEWDGRDANGDAMPSGIYFSKLMTATEDQTRKMVLVK